MKISIIGGGWVGCHLANILKKDHDVTLFEKNETIFKGTSNYNQNRLHYGYHYGRNHKTRELCKNTFYRFISDYGVCVSDVKRNFYCVPQKKSLLDLESYLRIFYDYPIEKTTHEFNNTEGCILTNEKHIDPHKAKLFFEEELEGLIKYEHIDNNRLIVLSNTSDLVIDTTNNFMGLIDDDCYYELTLTLIYNKIKETNYDSVTFVDGDLLSIYPYQENKYTLTDVKLTPLKKFTTIEELENFKKSITLDYINDKVIEFEKNVHPFIPNFKDFFEYDSYFLSIKSKVEDESGNRYPVIKKRDNIVSCFTGKIQGIYVIGDYIKKLINNE